MKKGKLTNKVLEMPKEWCEELPIFALKIKKVDRKEFDKIVATNIKFYRKLKKLDQRDLEKILDLPQNTITKIENYQRTIFAYELFKFAEVLEVSIEDLTSVRLPYNKFTKLSPFEITVLPMITLSYNKYLEKSKDKKKAEEEIQNALEVFEKVPEIWKLLGNLDAEKLKKVIKLVNLLE